MRLLPLLMALVLTAANTTMADVLQIPLSKQGDSAVPRPGKGMSKAEVEKLFGAPEAAQGPVGTPPITRWQYPDFVVTFEYDHVVHTVLKHKPKAPLEPTEQQSESTEATPVPASPLERP